MLTRGIRKIHRYYYMVVVLLCFLPFWPMLRVWAKKPEKNYVRILQARRSIAKWSSRLAGFKFQIQFETEINWENPFIICANHTSNLDIPAIISLTTGPHSFMGKAELIDQPITGLFFRTVDIPINRESRISSYRAFKKAEEFLDKKSSLIIFPEGKIGDQYPPHLHPFKTGPFKLAIAKQIPILPVVIHNTWEKMWDDGKITGSRPGIIRIEVLQPISTTGYTMDRHEDLLDNVFDLIQKKWKQRSSTL